jgi:hypothetical protein
LITSDYRKTNIAPNELNDLKAIADVEISNILKECDMETRMLIRDTARRIAEYGKRIQTRKD